MKRYGSVTRGSGGRKWREDERRWGYELAKQPHLGDAIGDRRPAQQPAAQRPDRAGEEQVEGKPGQQRLEQRPPRRHVLAEEEVKAEAGEGDRDRGDQRLPAAARGRGRVLWSRRSGPSSSRPGRRGVRRRPACPASSRRRAGHRRSRQPRRSPPRGGVRSRPARAAARRRTRRRCRSTRSASPGAARRRRRTRRPRRCRSNSRELRGRALGDEHEDRVEPREVDAGHDLHLLVEVGAEPADEGDFADLDSLGIEGRKLSRSASPP